MKGQGKKIGLALGSGGTRGLTIIGVIKSLEKHGIPIDYIAGSSIGAIVGGAYAIEKDITTIEDVALNFPYKGLLASMSDIGARGGLVQGNKFLDTIKQYIGEKKIEELTIPFTAVASDKNTGDAVLLERGSLADAMRASASIPIFFEPYSTSTTELLDGGVSQQVPAETVRNMGADIVIAVNLSENTSTYDHKSKISLVQHYILLLFRNLAAENCLHADITISPNFDNVNIFDNIKNRQSLIDEGERATEEKIDQILDLIKRSN